MQTSGWLAQVLLFSLTVLPKVLYQLDGLIYHPPQVKTLAMAGTPALGSWGHKTGTHPPLLFVLQVLGFEVDAVNSVQFSNHAGRSTRL